MSDTSGQVQHTSDGPEVAHQITTFSEQSALDTMQVSTPLPKYDMNPYKDDTLYGFLERPRLIRNVIWNDSAAAGSRLLSIDPYFDLLTSVPFRNKIENFNYFKAGLRIGIRINGTPFHYGKLLVTWKPMLGSMLQSNQEMRDNVFSASAYPNIIISPTENEVNEMVLPFAYDKAYMDLSMLEMRSPGILHIYVLNPLALDTSTPPVTVSVFANFEQVKLAGQSGIVNLPLHTSQEIYTDPHPAVITSTQPQQQGFVAQGDIKKEAIDKSSRGLISGPLKAVSAAAGALVPIPAIGMWAATISAVTNILGEVAEKFGYCKPNSLESTAPRINRLGDYAAGEGLDTAMATQVIPGQSVTDFSSDLGGDIGDMEMSSIASTPSLLGVFLWDGSNVVNDRLYSAPVDPSVTTVVQQSLSNRVFSTMLHWASRPFRFWRGSIRYDVQITCSNFHSGRLRVSFQPKNEGILTGFDYQNTINRIVDIQNETEFSFTVPYISNHPWSTLHNVDDTGLITDSIGFLEFSVVNDLTHTTEPIPEVHVNVWVSAGPDFQLAFPYRNTKRELGPIAPPIAFEAQGLTCTEMKEREHPPLMEGASGSVEHNICMVDTVTHLKQVTNRPQNKQIIFIDTNGVNQTLINLFDTALANSSSQVDYLDWFSNVFVFSRGSQNVRLIPRWDTLVSNLWVFMQTDWVAQYFTDTTRVYNVTSGIGQQVFDTSYNPSYEINVPWYASTFAYINGGTATESHSSALGIQMASNVNTLGETVNAFLFRSSGDDFTFSYLVGPPSYYLDVI